MAEWAALLQGPGLVVKAVPRRRRRPFANVLLVANPHTAMQTATQAET